MSTTPINQFKMFTDFLENEVQITMTQKQWKRYGEFKEKIKAVFSYEGTIDQSIKKTDDSTINQLDLF